MNFTVPRAGAENAFCGITPPGKTQLLVLVQFGRLYGSFAETVYPRRFDSTPAQYDPLTTIGFPSLSEKSSGLNTPARCWAVGNVTSPEVIPRVSLVPW